ncbi:hypothetical protein BUALT_Bualt01G0100800 [Buddleja alternifolia]|uniref:Uncharacterized protein n=1 Tax=Buddleja alternifolia TaxID=168488 RepID=A0AAV6YCW3_9LAMI|nr:hypothetical protein BUALT_Bualt01G0100800 [Buddleja alternifolia]
MDGQFPDAEGWSLGKEKFFFELLHIACGRNEINGGRLENNVLVGLQYRMNVEFGGFTETSVLNRFNINTRMRQCTSYVGEKYWDKLFEVFDDHLGASSVDNLSDAGNAQVQSGDTTSLVPDSDYLYNLICFAFKYELE